MHIYRAPPDANLEYRYIWQQIFWKTFNSAGNLCVCGQMVLPFYNMTDRLDSPVAPSGSAGWAPRFAEFRFRHNSAP